MTVYVDNAKNRYRGMLMSHMIADTDEELHEMAQRIGLKKSYFQDKNKRHPHYDVSQTKRTLAISYGTKEVTQQELIRIGRKRNEKTHKESHH